MRIGVIGTIGIPATYGGVERHVEELYSRLAARGHEITVYCRSFYTPKLIKTHKGIRLVRFPTIRRKHMEAPIHGFVSTIAALAKRFDVVHYHAMFPALFSAIPRICGSATVVTLHGLDWQREKWGWIARKVLLLGESASIHWPDATIVVSQRMRQYIHSKYRHEVYYVPNGVNYAHAADSSYITSIGLRPGNYLLYVAKLSPEKGAHFLIDAFNQLNLPDLHLVLAGGSRHSEQYIQLLKHMAGPNVHFLGFVTGEPLTQLFTYARFFVQPSTIEGLAISILEAMSYGLCVLCSDIPENREAIADCGVTFRNASVYDLKEKLSFLISSPEFARTVGLRAKQRVHAEYDWDQVARATERILYAAANRST